MQCRHLAELPAIRCKLQNLAKLRKSNPKKFTLQFEAITFTSNRRVMAGFARVVKEQFLDFMWRGFVCFGPMNLDCHGLVQLEKH